MCLFDDLCWEGVIGGTDGRQGRGWLRGRAGSDLEEKLGAETVRADLRVWLLCDRAGKWGWERGRRAGRGLKAQAGRV